MTRKEAAARLGVSESTITKASAAALHKAGLVRVGSKSNTTYRLTTHVDRAPRELFVDYSAIYAEEKVEKIKADKALVEQKTAAIRQENVAQAASIIIAALEEGFRGYVEALKTLETEDKDKLIEEYRASWEKALSTMRKSLRERSLI